jgi:hypothetical protein
MKKILVLYFILTALGCSSDILDELVYTEEREVCINRNPKRNLYFGDLHTHTGLSFDAWAYGNHTRPADVYSFAKGGELSLPPFDQDGRPTKKVKLARPLDFAAVTDHHEFIGEINLCLTDGSSSYDCSTCQNYREGGMENVVAFGTQLSMSPPERLDDVCNLENICLDAALQAWDEIKQAADNAYDRSASCAFTSFVAYEYTNSELITNYHRNIFFRNSVVPDMPPSYYEQTSIWGLLQWLDQNCLQMSDGCDVISIPHNSNWSNGALFDTDFHGALEGMSSAELAELRARLEPLVEVFQHKGDMECDYNFEQNQDDPQCDFEKQRFLPFDKCNGTPGYGGVSLFGCVSQLDFVRNVLKAGLAFEKRKGVNPYRLGVIGSTDTHNGIAGYVSEVDYVGHIGIVEDTAEERLGVGNMTHHGVRYNSGGLAGVWAVENSRDALFEAFRRRETYATTGPRIMVRMFAGFGLDDDICERQDRVSAGYEQGVPMGGVLEGNHGGKPIKIAVWADADLDPRNPNPMLLQQIQVIKAWLDGDGNSYEKIYAIAGDANNGASVDLATCQTSGSGYESLCGVFSDPEFDPAQAAFYYARVIENPTCRWSVRQCNALSEAEKPDSCKDPKFYRAIQERAYTSPVWYQPSK